MPQFTLSDRAVALLIETAREKTFYDTEETDFDLYDACGGNIDDAYGMGARDGEIEHTRMILNELGIKY